MTLLDQLTEAELVPLLEDAMERTDDAATLLVHEHGTCCPSLILQSLLYSTIKLALEVGVDSQVIHSLIDRFRREDEDEEPHAGKES